MRKLTQDKQRVVMQWQMQAMELQKLQARMKELGEIK